MFAKSFRFTLWIAAPAFAVLALLAPAEEASAQKKNKQAKNLAKLEFAPAILTLQSVKLTLEKADHDYGGHRAAAVRDVKAAIHQLNLAHHHLHKGKTGVKNKGGNVKGGGEPQALSNSQLAAAVPALRQVQVALQQTTHDLGGHRANAIRDLGAAISQLERALQYSAVRNRKKV